MQAVELRTAGPADADAGPVGHVTVSGHRLVHLFVDPGHQGRGLGRRLLALGEAMIAAGGHAELELHARVENRAAIAFYERAGWTVTDRVIRTSSTASATTGGFSCSSRPLDRRRSTRARRRSDP